MMSPELWLLILAAALMIGILSGVPVMLAIAGVPVLVAGVASLFGDFDLSFFGAYPQRVFGIMENPLLIAVPLFVLMGLLLEKSRVAERMLLTMAGFFGQSRAGLAYSVLLVSALIAASTGIIGATIVMLGVISLPAMLKSGLPSRLSSGLICASGTLGQIIPPSIVLILLGDQISNAYLEAQRNAGNFAPDPVSVGDLFAGALLPGLLLVALYAVYVFLHSRFVPAEFSSTNELAETSQVAVGFREILLTFIPPVLLIIAVLGSILIGVATPTEAAAVGVAGTLLIAAAHGEHCGLGLRGLIVAGALSAFVLAGMKSAGFTHIDLNAGAANITAGTAITVLATLMLVLALAGAAVNLLRFRVLVPALYKSISVSAMVFGIIVAASMLSLVFRGFGGDDVVAELLGRIPGDKWGALLAVMLVIFLLGFLLEFVEIVFIVIPIVGPVLLGMDFHPVWFAVLIALNLQTSFLTPPFGFALFYFRSVAPESIKTTDIYLSVIPFVMIQLLAMLVLVYFPELATWLPDLILN